MPRRDTHIRTGPLKGYRVIGHDRNNPCPSCRRSTYCKDCGVCEACGFTHGRSTSNESN